MNSHISEEVLFDSSNQILPNYTLLYNFVLEDLVLWMKEAKSGSQTWEDNQCPC